MQDARAVLVALGLLVFAGLLLVALAAEVLRELLEMAEAFGLA